MSGDVTWPGMLPALVLLLEYGTEEGKRIAYVELERMAHAAQQCVYGRADNVFDAPSPAQLVQRARTRRLA